MRNLIVDLINFARIYNLGNIFVLKVLVVSVFDLCDSSALERAHFADGRPLLPELALHRKNELVLLLGPLSADDRRIEHVVPPLATLAAKTPRQVVGNDNPVGCAVDEDFLFQDCVFLFGPGGNERLHFVGVLVEPLPLVALLGFELVPALEALDLRLVRHLFAQLVPRVLAVDGNKFDQFFVLYSVTICKLKLKFRIIFAKKRGTNMYPLTTENGTLTSSGVQ